MHVDIVMNDWNAEVQRYAGSVIANGSLACKDIDAPGVRASVEIAIQVAEEDSDDPRSQLDRIVEVLDGSLLFATVPHGEDACPFANTTVIAMDVELTPEGLAPPTADCR